MLSDSTPESRMNVGKTLFAQVMEFVPWKTFARIIERHKAMWVFVRWAVPTCFVSWPSRNSLAGVVARHRGMPGSQSAQAVSHGDRHAPPFDARDALNLRDWHIYHALASG